MSHEFEIKEDCEIKIENTNVKFPFKKGDVVNIWCLSQREREGRVVVQEFEWMYSKNGNDFASEVVGVIECIKLRQALEKSEFVEYKQRGTSSTPP